MYTSLMVAPDGQVSIAYEDWVSGDRDLLVATGHPGSG